MTPSNALQAAVFSRLNGYSALTALIGSNQVFDFIPEDVQPPYVVIGDDTLVDWGTKTTHGWDVTLTIHCWDFEKAGRKSVKNILSAIYDALHEQDVTVSGFNLVQLRFDFGTTMQDPGVQGQGDRFYHGVHRYRALIQS